MSFPKPQPELHKWDLRGQCSRCRLMKHRLTITLPCRAAKQHKYNAKKTVVEGQSFPSGLEARTWTYLRVLEQQKELTELSRQATVTFPIVDIKYKADMKYTNKKGQTVWVEAKGMEGDRWKIIKKIWKALGPGDLEVYKDRGNGLYLAETIKSEKL